MSTYETLFITDSSLSSEEQNALTEKFSQLIEKQGGKVTKLDQWGKRVFAYPINKQTEGYYTLLEYTGDGAVVSELERKMKIEDNILRLMTINLDDAIKLQEKQNAKLEKKKKARASKIVNNEVEEGE
jgi:small subunit ribosomal protein S6